MSRKTDKKYWDYRYQRGQNSGMGSYGDEAVFKLKEIDKFIDDKGLIKSVLDVGCGDINMALQFMPFFLNAQYLGIDISKVVIERHLSKKLAKLNFKIIENSIFKYSSDIVICFDILFHIMDDNDYRNMLISLKKSWTKYLLIATYDNRQLNFSPSSYIKKRKFEPKFFSEKWQEIIVPFYSYNKSLYFFKK